MKALLLIIPLVFSISVYAQENGPAFDGHKWEAPYELSIPKDWAIERFLLPSSFAPQILYKGVEDIRFTLGWANKKSEEYWSYAFLWCLDTKPSLNESIIENDLKAYYTGLFKINSDSSKSPEKVIPVTTQFKKNKQVDGDLLSYIGTIQMQDYMTLNPITLNCKVHFKSCPAINKEILFFELSPQSFEHKIWSALDQLWLDFKCKKK